MPDYHIPLIPDKTYHIFSRAMGKEKLFLEEDNYRYFLKQFSKYISPIADTFTYNLLPNHFHFLIRIKNTDAIQEEFLKVKKNKKFVIELIPDFVMERFSNLLNSYTKAFNKKYSRIGGLFIDIMRRIEIKDDSQFGATIFYIHKNAVHHGYVNNISDWRWSSYYAFISNASTLLLRDEVLDWFGGIEQFIEFHKQPIYLKSAVIVEE
jgi:putative transposase